MAVLGCPAWIDGLERLARRNFGVFTRAQAAACGYSRFQVLRRLKSGDWQVVLGKVLAPAGLKVTQAIRDRAAQLSVPGSVLGGPSAARAMGIDVADKRTFLYVGPHGRVRLPGVAALHSWPDPKDVFINEGLPAVVPACALMESLLALPHRAAVDLLDRSVAQHPVG